MKILVLASDNPSPPINGTRIRNFHLWPILKAQGHEVKLLCLTKNPQDLNHHSDDKEFFLFTRKNIFKRIYMRLLHSYHEWPVSDDLTRRVQSLVSEWQPDIIHAEEFRMGQYIPRKNTLSAQTLTSVCAHNVESQLIKKTLAAPFPYAIKFFNRIYQITLKRAERKVFHNVDLRLTYSEVDKNIYASLYPKLTWVSSSNGVPLINLNESDLKTLCTNNILFLGSLNYLPNIEGLYWFLDHIYPNVKQNCKLTVAGSNPPEKVKIRLKTEDVELIDTPLELGPVYLENGLLIVPLLNGSGTRGKILESLMYARPVLTTSLGVEGLQINAGQGIIVGDGIEGYTSALKDWLNLNSQERQKMAMAGRDLILKKYTWHHVASDLIKYWEKGVMSKRTLQQTKN